MSSVLLRDAWRKRLQRLLRARQVKAHQRGSPRLALEWLEERAVPAAVFTVTNTASDNSTGSFLWALQQATSGADTINFNIGTPGVVQTIALQSTVFINTPVTIDATSEQGAAHTPVIELTGQGNPYAFGGLDIFASNTTVRGLIIDSFNGNGITLDTGGNNVIAGNYIGTDTSGTAAAANAGNGILIFDGSSNDTIGGLTAADRNVISGNTGDGIAVNGSMGENQLHSNGIVVVGNYIGTDATGSATLGNGLAGVHLELGATNDTIGGVIAGAGNVISGNGVSGSHSGIDIADAGTSNNVIAGNFIGTNAAGNAALANSDNGIAIFSSASNNLIGGTTAAAANLISGNTARGVELFSGASNNVIEGNLIGVTVNGAALGNGSGGVAIGNMFEGGTSSSNTIGGTSAGAGNLIANNGIGVAIIGATSADNAILGNSITNNSVIGISLDAAGANNAQASPNTTTAWIDSAGDLLIDYSVGSEPASAAYPLRVEFFKADGLGEGKTFVSFDTYSSSDFSTGNKVVNLGSAAAHGIAAGDQLVLTATDSNGNTSEFSTATQVTDSLVVTNTNDSGAGSLRQAILDADADTSPTTITFGMKGDQTITLATYLPAITQSMVIDGTTEGGFAGTPLIEIYGGNIQFSGGLPAGLEVFANNTTIRGLAVNGFAGQGSGIELIGSGNRIAGNYIGLALDGTTAQGNSFPGIYITDGSSNNIIGGTSAADRSVISGNGDTGVYIGDGTGQSGNIISGNYIGTSADGTTAVGNGRAGIFLNGGVSNTTIAGNVISGNATGVFEATAAGTLFVGNNIGLNAAQTGALANNGPGIFFAGGTSNDTVGGTSAAAGNVISNNTGDGILVQNGSTAILIQGNTITNNADGVNLDGATTANVTIEQNTMSGNDGLGIDLLNGANNSQAAPLVARAWIDSVGDLLVNYFVDSAPTASAYPLHIEFFKSDFSGQGQSFAGFDTFTATDFNNGGKVVNLGSAAAHGIAFDDLLVLTATDANGNTSEFSFESFVNDRLVVTNSSDSGPGSLRQAILDADADTAGANTITFLSEGSLTIEPLSPLPAITSPVVIDATTQGGMTGTSFVVLSGANAGPGAIGLDISAGNSSVLGLEITQFTTAIKLEGGGNDVLENNVITANSGNGIVVVSQGNTILSNSIFANATPGILLSGSGNNGQNAPVIYTFDGTTITGALSGTPHTLYHLQFFTSPANGPARQGQTLVAEQDVTTDAAGNAAFSVVVANDPTGTVLTATATNETTGDTSGFSAGLPVAASAGTTTQTATVNTTFAAPLSVVVTDAYGEPVSGIPVVFSAPASGASGTFAGGVTTLTVLTDANGIASPLFTANTVPGTYTVTASMPGLPPITFTLTNVPAAVATFVVTAPSNLNQGAPLSLSIRAVDPFGNTVTSFNGTVALSSDDPFAQLSGPVSLTAGVGTFANVGTLSSPGSHTITVTDTASPSVSGSTTITVNNLAPSNLTLDPSATSLTEGDVLTLSGSFSDVGQGDAHTVVIHWGDGTPDTTLTLDPGVFSFQTTHAYDQGSPVASPTLMAALQVTVSDASAAVSAGTTILVTNVAPVVTLSDGLPVVNIGVPLGVTGSFADPGLETFVGLVDYGDGTGLQSLPLNADHTFTLDHVYTRDGSFFVTVSVNDGHTGIGVASLLANVVLVGVNTPGVSVAATNGTGTATASTTGITATLTTALGKQAFILVSVVPTNVASGLLAPAAQAPNQNISFSYDVRAIGVSNEDSVRVTFSYRGNNPQLRFVDANGRLQTITGSTDPSKSPSFVINAANHTITVVFDGTSTPAITALTGTVFTISVTASNEPQQVGLFQLQSPPVLVAEANTFSNGTASDVSSNVATGNVATAPSAGFEAANGGGSDSPGNPDGSINPLNLLPTPPPIPPQQSTAVLSPSQPNPIGALDDQHDQSSTDETKPAEQAEPTTRPQEAPPPEDADEPSGQAPSSMDAAPVMRPEQSPPEGTLATVLNNLAARLDREGIAENAPSALDLAFAAGVFLAPYIVGDAPALLDERREKKVLVGR